MKCCCLVLPLVAVGVFLISFAPAAHSYLPGGCLTTQTGPSCTANALVPLHWSVSAPIVYNINPNTTGAKINGSRTAASVIDASFAVWIAAPNTSLPIVRGADTTVSAESASPGNINLICFVCTDTNFASDASTLAVTLFTYVTGPGQPDGRGGTTKFAGQIIKADILFNPTPSPPNFPATSFTTNAGAATLTQTTNVVDLQTVAMHEIGHFLGMDHSAVTTAVMYPFAPSIPRDTLAYDDVAGISQLYPGVQTVRVGSLQGTVQYQSGGNVFGAHVFADSTTATNGYGAAVRKGPIGAMTDPNGVYNIQGLPVDSYAVTAEPLDGPVTNDAVAGYPAVFGQPAVQTGFSTRQH